MSADSHCREQWWEVAVVALHLHHTGNAVGTAALGGNASTQSVRSSEGIAHSPKLLMQC